jgi:hypothetical protein
MWSKSKAILEVSELLSFKDENRHSITDIKSSGHSTNISISGVGSDAFAMQGKIASTTKNNNLFTA